MRIVIRLALLGAVAAALESCAPPPPPGYAYAACPPGYHLGPYGRHCFPNRW